MDSAHATFIVRDAELTGAEITGLLGLQPSWVSERGQPVSRRNPGSPVRQHTTWALSSGLPESEVLQSHLLALLDVVSPARAAISQLLQHGSDLCLSCMVTASPTGNLVEVEAETLSRIAHTGLALVLDVYDSDPDDREAPSAITTIGDLEPAARHPAEQLARLLTAHEPTGEEPLMAIFEWALERLNDSRD
jgi:Domain of unknown function (DUF4279)